MIEYSKNILRKNVFKLLRFSGITDEQFANVIDISLRKLKYVKKGLYDFTLEDIGKISIFFNQDFDKITTVEVCVNTNFRNELLKVHRLNTEYKKILEDSPPIHFAIEFFLLNDSEFQNKKLEVKEILIILRKYGWEYRSTSVSKELNRMKTLINSIPHPYKKGTNLYFKA